MLVFRGAPALSEFRLRKLEQRLLTETRRPFRVYAEHMHFADLERDLTGDETAVLERLEIK
jgi:phosphoribosylformylglycinamidine synthase